MNSPISSNLPSCPVAILNSAAGSADDIADELTALACEQGLSLEHIIASDPVNIEADFRAAIKKGADLLIVFGGDGTCKTGAAFARSENIPLIPLPGGTMNLLQKWVYGTDVWQEALTIALTARTLQWLPAGLANDSVFFVAAMLGDSIIMADVREDLRSGDVLSAVSQMPDIIDIMSDADVFRYKIRNDGEAQKADGMIISCPSMASGANKPSAFEFAVVNSLGLPDIIGIGTQALISDWRESEHVEVGYSENIVITGRKSFDVLLDGERECLAGPLTISLDPQGVQVMAPTLRNRFQK